MPAGRPGDLYAFALRGSQEVCGQRRLADAGLTTEQHKLPVPGRRVGEHLREDAQGVTAPPQLHETEYALDAI